jgi:hypothetical protein
VPRALTVLQLKVVQKSGLNRDGTYLPPAIHPSFAKEPQYDMKTAMVEAEMVMGGVVADLLEKTGEQQQQQHQHLQGAGVPTDTGGGHSTERQRRKQQQQDEQLSSGSEGAAQQQGAPRPANVAAAATAADKAVGCALAAAADHCRTPCRLCCAVPAGIKPEQIDILITNCSIFCPTPSLASMLINKFKFRRDIQSYNLGGMGCSIGVIAIGLVRDMLQAHPNSIALFVPAEITTYCFYPGAWLRTGGGGMRVACCVSRCQPCCRGKLVAQRGRRRAARAVQPAAALLRMRRPPQAYPACCSRCLSRTCTATPHRPRQGLPGGQRHLPHGRRRCANDQQARAHALQQVRAVPLRAHPHRPG